jgi:hypothetical protein
MKGASLETPFIVRRSEFVQRDGPLLPPEPLELEPPEPPERLRSLWLPL